ncbi:hypothetical protein NQ317_007487 [Molorchus minor]|uniref:Uncharacterized protein n=1 Tax=Molorchus minor TaxID=1323400 RepID=A0ABQ9K1U1_9CUCU|nr:hypothetical protein NQ317_007487 [Molorchus minor]
MTAGVGIVLIIIFSVTVFAVFVQIIAAILTRRRILRLIDEGYYFIEVQVRWRRKELDPYIPITLTLGTTPPQTSCSSNPMYTDFLALSPPKDYRYEPPLRRRILKTKPVNYSYSQKSRLLFINNLICNLDNVHPLEKHFYKTKVKMDVMNGSSGKHHNSGNIYFTVSYILMMIVIVTQVFYYCFVVYSYQSIKKKIIAKGRLLQVIPIVSIATVNMPQNQVLTNFQISSTGPPPYPGKRTINFLLIFY